MAVEKSLAKRSMAINVKDGVNADGTDKLKACFVKQAFKHAQLICALGKAFTAAVINAVLLLKEIKRNINAVVALVIVILPDAE